MHTGELGATSSADDTAVAHRDAHLDWAEDALLPDDVRAALTGPGAPFEMVDEDVLGAQMRVFAHRPRTMGQVLEAAGERFGDRPFLVFPERTFTHRSLSEAVASVAAALSDRYGIGPGDRVAVAAANCVGHALTAWAVACLGATVVELNGWWTAAEMLQGIELTQPKAIVGDRRRIERLDGQGLPVPVVCFEDDLVGLEAEGRGSALPPDGGQEDAPLCILFTSGTTGRPKGAVLSHRAHIHMMMQAALQGAVAAASRSGAHRGTGAPARPGCSIGVSPMFHVSGFSVALMGGAFHGSTIAYPPPGRWDPGAHLEMTERYGASAWSLVPTQLWRLLEHPGFDDIDLSSLKRVGGGGATFQPELWRKVREKLPHLELMATGYGMTETCGAGTHQDGLAAHAHPDAVGAPVPGYSISIRDAHGRVRREGEVGEIWLRGPSNLLCYWGDPAATARAIDADRWYHTNEMGHIGGGLLYLDGRAADLIVRAGENVYPVEIENRLVEHPAVAEAAVIGVEDRVVGEEVEAVVVLHDGARLDLDEVRRWVGVCLAPFKVPTRLRVVGSLPHNAAGKVNKQALRHPESTASTMVEE